MKRLWYVMRMVAKRDWRRVQREAFEEEHDPYMQWLDEERKASDRRQDLTYWYGYRNDEEGPP